MRPRQRQCARVVLLGAGACAPPSTVSLEQVRPGDAERVTYATRADGAVDYR